MIGLSDEMRDIFEICCLIQRSTRQALLGWSWHKKLNEKWLMAVKPFPNCGRIS